MSTLCITYLTLRMAMAEWTAGRQNLLLQVDPPYCPKCSRLSKAQIPTPRSYYERGKMSHRLGTSSVCKGPFPHPPYFALAVVVLIFEYYEGYSPSLYRVPYAWHIIAWPHWNGHRSISSGFPFRGQPADHFKSVRLPACSCRPFVSAPAAPLTTAWLSIGYPVRSQTRQDPDDTTCLQCGLSIYWNHKTHGDQLEDKASPQFLNPLSSVLAHIFQYLRSLPNTKTIFGHPAYFWAFYFGGS